MKSRSGPSPIRILTTLSSIFPERHNFARPLIEQALVCFDVEWRQDVVLNDVVVILWRSSHKWRTLTYLTLPDPVCGSSDYRHSTPFSKALKGLYWFWFDDENRHVLWNYLCTGDDNGFLLGFTLKGKNAFRILFRRKLWCSMTILLCLYNALYLQERVQEKLWCIPCHLF